MVESKEIITFERNIVSEHCNLINEIKMKVLTKVHQYFHDKGIAIPDIFEFFKDPHYPGKNKLGLKQIVRARLNEIIGENYFRIQDAMFPIREFSIQIFNSLFPKNREDIDSNFSNQPHFRKHEGKIKQNRACLRNRSGKPGKKLEVRECLPSKAPLPLKNNGQSLLKNLQKSKKKEE